MRVRTALGRLLLGGTAVAAVLVGVPSARDAVARAAHEVAAASASARQAREREQRIVRFARRYHIDAALASAVERAAVAEGLDPELAFRLVRVESGFRERAVSSAGALGLTQLMPATARSLEPGITREQIFQRDTNLHLGFRYLRWLLDVYDGDLRDALHAYNRGPGTVDRIRAAGGDPANGYARRVLHGGRVVPYRGSGFLPPSALVSPADF